MPLRAATVEVKLLPELQTESYFSKEFTMNLIIARRMIALAALLAPTVMAACDLCSTNSPSETLTVYQDAPALHLH